MGSRVLRAQRPQKAKALPKQSSRTVAIAHDHVNTVMYMSKSSTIQYVNKVMLQYSLSYICRECLVSTRSSSPEPLIFKVPPTISHSSRSHCPSRDLWALLPKTKGQASIAMFPFRCLSSTTTTRTVTGDQTHAHHSSFRLLARPCQDHPRPGTDDRGIRLPSTP